MKKLIFIVFALFLIFGCSTTSSNKSVTTSVQKKENVQLPTISKNWETTVEETYQMYPVKDYVVLFNQNRFKVLRKSNGEEIYTHTFNKKEDEDCPELPFVSDNYILINFLKYVDKKKVMATLKLFDLKTGNQIWKKDKENIEWQGGYIFKDKVFVGKFIPKRIKGKRYDKTFLAHKNCKEAYLVCFDAKTGNELWKIGGKKDKGVFRVEYASDDVIIVRNNYEWKSMLAQMTETKAGRVTVKIYSVNPENGKIYWQKKKKFIEYTLNPYENHFAVDNNMVYYIKKLYDLKTGKVVSKVPLFTSKLSYFKYPVIYSLSERGKSISYYNLKTKKITVGYWVTFGDVASSLGKAALGSILAQFVDMSLLYSIGNGEIQEIKFRVSYGTHIPDSDLKKFYISDDFVLVSTMKKIIRFSLFKQKKLKQVWNLKRENILFTNVKKGDLLLVFDNGQSAFLNINTGEIIPDGTIILKKSDNKDFRKLSSDMFILSNHDKVELYQLK